MNRSFSKIRHIQEANQRLEKRLLKEDESQTSSSGTDKLEILKDVTNIPEVQEFLSQIWHYGTKAIDLMASILVLVNPFNWQRDKGCEEEKERIYGITAEDKGDNCWELTDVAKEKLNLFWSNYSVSGKLFEMTKDKFVDFLGRNLKELQKLKTKFDSLF